MIHVKPATNDQIAEIFDNNIFEGANAMIATDTETGEVVGHSKFSIIKGRMGLPRFMARSISLGTNFDS